MNNINLAQYTFKSYDDLLITYLQLDKFIQRDILIKFNIKMIITYNPRGDYYNLFFKCKTYNNAFGLYLLCKLQEWFGDIFEKIKTT